MIETLIKSVKNIFRLCTWLILAGSYLVYCPAILAQQAPEGEPGRMAGQVVENADSPEPGLLFYLSGDQSFTADFAAGGQIHPNFLRDVNIIEDGAIGSAFEAENSQLMSYWAPGNIYAQHGTLSFFWRSRYPVGPTAFPIFRVAFADHSSWDMVWLRIDYNGSGFDAFVTDVGLARTRVSHYMEQFPKPEEWTHIALAWDETEGIRLYINGKLVEQQSINGEVYDTGLDQFGPHSRIISPYQVQSRYNFMRGGDLDELRIYDRMLSDENIIQLAKGELPKNIPPLKRDFSNRKWRDEWWTRHGWNLPNDPPPALTSQYTSVKKLGIHDAVDVKRWMWKANDGIRETTWPGVYNMSRLPGRYDYFTLPDWDTYSMSGQTIRFKLPDEPWNHVEMWGTAWGQLTHESYHHYDSTFAVRTKEQVKSYHRLKTPRQGGAIRFDNAVIEEPVGEFSVYNVQEGHAPSGRKSESFSLAPAPSQFDSPGLQEVASFIRGRYPADERAGMIGIKDDQNLDLQTEILPENNQPLIHIILPYSDQPNVALEGVEIELPALSVTPTHGALFPMNIRVKDPLWQMRDLADFSFSIKSGQAHTLWIDTRDRILPEGRALYLTLSGAGQDLTPALLKGAKVRMVYTSKEAGKKEHELDRFTQVRDLYGFTVEEHPDTPRFNLYNRLKADLDDLLKVNPDHWLGKTYKYAVSRDKADRPEYKIPEAPDGVPQWAHLQAQYLERLQHIIDYYIDQRQVSNGEFGGGLSDDGDFTNLFPSTAFLGIEPEKTLNALRLHMKAYYDQERDPYEAPLKQRSLPLFSNGLATIFTDELHAYEDGIQVVGQLELLDYGNPLYLERGMEIAKRILEDITQINPAGHRHFRTRYYSGTKMATEDPWQWSVSYSYNLLHTAYMLVRYNGNPRVKQMIIEIADGLLAHRHDGGIYTEIHFETDEDRGEPGIGRLAQIFKAAYDWTGDKKYLEVAGSWGQIDRTFDKNRIVDRYTDDIKTWGTLEYINTKGSVWIDRTTRDNATIQEDRLGGVALRRISNIYPQNKVSWKFSDPADNESVAFFVSKADQENLTVIAYNMSAEKVQAEMTPWDLAPGRWKIRQGIDADENQQIDGNANEQDVALERRQPLKLSFAPHQQTIIQLQLQKKASTGYWERPDLGVGPADIDIKDGEVTVRVHSLGAEEIPPSTLQIRDEMGNIVATGDVPSLEAPDDLIPKWTDVTLQIPKGTDLEHGSVQVDPNSDIIQITRQNTHVEW